MLVWMLWRMKTPVTSWPARFKRTAETLESIPPLIAKSTRVMSGTVSDPPPDYNSLGEGGLSPRFRSSILRRVNPAPEALDPAPPRTFAFVTFGCKVNQYESQAL